MLEDYLNARVSMMSSRLLDVEEVHALVSNPPQDNAAILDRAGLGDLIEDIAAGRYLEQSIIRAQLVDILILMRAAGRARDFLKYWALRFEMTNLKAIIRGRMAGATTAEIRQELSDMGFLTRLPVDELLQTEDIGELLRRLEATAYADMVRFARRAFEAQPRLFDLDAALDRHYYHGLATHAYRLEGELGQSFRKIMALYLDRVNLVWLLRFRFDYALPAAQVYYLLIPSRYRLSSDMLKDLVTMRRLGDVLAGLPMPYREWLKDARGLFEVGMLMDRHLAMELRATLHSPASAFARAFAYLVLRDHDLRRVRAILKGWSLGLDREIISQAAGLEALPVVEVAEAA